MPLISLFWDIRIVSLCIVRPSQPLARLSLYYILVGTRGWGSLVFYMHSYIYLSSQSCILLLAVVVHTVILMTFIRSFAAITLFLFTQGDLIFWSPLHRSLFPLSTPTSDLDTEYISTLSYTHTLQAITRIRYLCILALGASCVCAIK